MPRKKRARPKFSRRQISGGVRDDRFLLDQFSTQDLRRWKRNSNLLNRYRVRQFYELEGLRELSRESLVDALKQTPYDHLRINEWARIVNYRYSDQPLSAKGSLFGGGRFNIGSNLDSSRFTPFPALYIATDYDTAYAERFGSPPNSGPGLQPHELSLVSPRSFTNVCLNGEAHGLFDLRSQRNLSRFSKIISEFRMPSELLQLATDLGLPGPLLLTKPKLLFDSLMGTWTDMPSQYGLPSNSQIFARFVREAGFEGIVYKSTKGPGICVALFLDMWEGSDSYVELGDEAPFSSTITRLDQNSAKDLY